MPPDTFLVSVTGEHGGTGSAAQPINTLVRAIEAAPEGATIVLRQGIYREGVPFVSKRLTIQPYPHEKVWLKGSIVVDDWVSSGPHWKKARWRYQFDSDTFDAGALDPVNPYAGHPDMVFVDGQPLRQVGSRANVRQGTFFVDYDNEELYIGDDPHGRSVEVSVHSRGLRVSAGGTIVRGLGFMHYASGRFEGALQFDGADNVTIENNTFAWSASKGLAMYEGNGAVVRGNTFLNNGQLGFGAWRYDNVLVEGNRFAGNNQENFRLHGPVTEAAGAKITVGKNWIIQDNIFANNLATALWLDISNHNVNIVGNRVIDNLSYGIYFEISAKAIIASNVVVGNSSGIRVSNSSDVKIYNNTIVRNADNVWIQDDSRQNDDPAELKLGISYVTANIELRNNIFSNGDSSQNPFVLVRDYNSDPEKSADQMISTCDSNAYYREDSEVPAKLISWWRGSKELTFSDLDDFREGTGHERNGVIVDDVAENPFFAVTNAGDYRLKPNSIASGAGAKLPPMVADAIGVAAGVVVDLGVLNLNRTENYRSRDTACPSRDAPDYINGIIR